MLDYSKLTLDQLIEKISTARFFNLPRMISEALKKVKADPYKAYVIGFKAFPDFEPTSTIKIFKNTFGDVVCESIVSGGYRFKFQKSFDKNKTTIIFPSVVISSSSPYNVERTIGSFIIDDKTIEIKPMKEEPNPSLDGFNNPIIYTVEIRTYD